MIQTIRNLVKYQSLHVPEKPSREAYNLWSENYDDQPDNLMFYLDQWAFTELMHPVTIRDKDIADIGCGTGRHWPMLFQNRASSITGYDVSEGMLNRLKLKFPDANTVKLTDNFLVGVSGNSYDMLMSTLTIAHIENIEETLTEWCRVLRKGGDMIITDFHPRALAAGGRRTFQYHNEHIPIVNFVHNIETMKAILRKQGMVVIAQLERIIDDSVMHYYIKQDAMHVYNKFRGMPMIYGLHLKKL